MKRVVILFSVFLLAAVARAAESKAMTEREVQAALAERTGLTKAQVKSVLDELAKLAYEEADSGFPVPGIGKLVVAQRAARVGRNPSTGEPIEIPAKKAVKFRVSKACREAVVGTGKSPGT